jgi:hypothetical protein
MRGHRPFALAGQRDGLIERIAQQPDLPLRALQAEFQGRGIKVSYFAVWNIVARAGLSFKKSLQASEQDRPNVARRRLQWQQRQNKVDPRRLVFVDETWAKTNMTPIRGRCPVGERQIAKVPHGHRKTLTFVVALRCDGIRALCLLDQPINTISFPGYVEQFLVPTLRPGDVVVMDNLSSHKGPAIRKAIRAAGAKLIFLPPIVRTSTRPSRCSPNSKRCCARPNARTIEPPCPEMRDAYVRNHGGCARERRKASATSAGMVGGEVRHG